MVAFTIVDNQETWNTALGTLGDGHLLQSWQWGELKSKYGWKPARILWHDDSQTPIAAAQLLFRTTTGNLTIAYCPRGPILNWEDPVLYSRVLRDLSDHASQHRAIFVKMVVISTVLNSVLASILRRVMILTFGCESDNNRANASSTLSFTTPEIPRALIP